MHEQKYTHEHIRTHKNISKTLQIVIFNDANTYHAYHIHANKSSAPAINVHSGDVNHFIHHSILNVYKNIYMFTMCINSRHATV